MESNKGARHTGIDLQISKEVEVDADPFLIQQLFGNLLSNAMDALPNGGNIIIEFFVEDGFQVVRISNSGRIPPPETLKQIFEPYFTLKTRGTGLGLAICQRIVTAHHGFIRARVESGIFVIETGLPGRPENQAGMIS